MPIHPTVTLQLTQAIVQNAQRLGIELPSELIASIPASGRTPMSLQNELWDAFCSASKDPLIGLKLGQSLQVGHLDMVGMLLMSCDTLGEAIDLLIEYHPVVGEGGDFHHAHQGGDSLLIYEPHYRQRQRERVESVTACVLNLARWITGDHFEAKSVQFTASSAGANLEYEALLQCPVRFAAPCNAIRFSPQRLATPLIQANSSVRDQMRLMADATLRELGQDGLSARVKVLIRQQPAWGRERIAAELNMSGRHLIRKLQEEGSTFKLLRSGLLQQMAETQLASGATIAQVAEELGFSDESAFVKAFKRWAGITPAQFRNLSED